MILFLQKLVLIAHSSSRVRVPGPGVSAFSLQLPFCGAVICVMYAKRVLCIKYVGSQPKTVTVLTNFLAVELLSFFGEYSHLFYDDSDCLNLQERLS